MNSRQTMVPLRGASRALAMVVLATGVGALAACSSAETSLTSPSGVRCPVTLAVTPASVGPEGGRGEIAITVNRDCAWEAESTAAWIDLIEPTSGQGDATLAYTVDVNPVVASRRGGILVNGQRTEVAQSAAPCTYELSAPAGQASAIGGSLTVRVNAPDSCGWTASSALPWVRVDVGRQGSGDGVVSMSVSPNPGPLREGRVDIAGQPYTVIQAAVVTAPPPPGPTPAPTPLPPAPPPTPTPTPPAPPTPTPPAPPTATPTPTPTVPPPPPVPTPTPTPPPTPVPTPTLPPPTPTPVPCSFSVTPTAESFGALGGLGQVRVDATGAGCAWTATSDAPWITVRDERGSGTASVGYTVRLNLGSSRQGTLVVAGQTVVVTQDGLFEGAEVELDGDVSSVSGSCPDLTFQLEGRTVRTTAATEFEPACQSVRNGREAEVDGVEQADGTVLARRVEWDDD